jgi:hypothetical protein
MLGGSLALIRVSQDSFGRAYTCLQPDHCELELVTLGDDPVIG